ncbi:MAG: glycosyltransferase [Clostridia bacterium]|nr:glycosyltransferase [Clostridia bacterium]
MTQPLVSVIMGIYNCEGSLGTAIDSLCNQTYSNWELILCDDCSTDGTYSVARQYADKYDNIHLIRNAVNSKLSYSLNQCLKVARGEYVARMDGDDICLPERFEKQVQYLQEHPDMDVVGSGLIPYDETGEKAERLSPEFPSAKHLVHGVPFFHPTIMMRKACYDALDGYLVSKRTQKGQDYDLWFRFFAAGYQGANLQIPLVKYHESLTDYKHKRSVATSWRTVQTKFIGFRLNHFPIYWYPFVLKPLVSALIPKKLMHLYHTRKR